MSTVLAILPVDTEIESELVKGDNYLANYLTLAKYIEQMQWQESNELIAQLNIEASLCLEDHQEAIA
jgi:c-di-GMP-related signal transduction protein